MYMYIYISMYVCMYVYIYICMYAYIWCMLTYADVCNEVQWGGLQRTDASLKVNAGCFLGKLMTYAI